MRDTTKKRPIKNNGVEWRGETVGERLKKKINEKAGEEKNH